MAATTSARIGPTRGSGVLTFPGQAGGGSRRRYEFKGIPGTRKLFALVTEGRPYRADADRPGARQRDGAPPSISMTPRSWVSPVVRSTRSTCPSWAETYDSVLHGFRKAHPSAVLVGFRPQVRHSCVADYPGRSEGPRTPVGGRQRRGHLRIRPWTSASALPGGTFDVGRSASHAVRPFPGIPGARREGSERRRPHHGHGTHRRRRHGVDDVQAPMGDPSSWGGCWPISIVGFTNWRLRTGCTTLPSVVEIASSTSTYIH